MEDLFLYLLVVANLFSLIHIGFYMVGANVYDIFKFRKSYSDSVKKRRYKTPHPTLVSVVIPAHNEARVIRRTLDSVLASTYKNIEIIVVNDGSTDKTNEIVKKYIKRVKKSPKLRVATYLPKDGRAVKLKKRYIRSYLSKCRIKLINQKNQGKAAAMNNAIKNQAKGRYVMCLDADSILHPQAIERAAAYFKDNSIVGVAANVRIMENRTILGKVQRFEHMIGYRSKKFYSVTNSEFIIGGVASTYRKSMLKKVKFYDNDTVTEDIGLSLKIIALNGNKKHRVVYASDVVALTEGVNNFKDLLKQRYRWKKGNLQNIFKYRHLIGNYEPLKYSSALTLYRLPVAIISEIILMLEPLIIGYIVYLSFTYHTIGIVLGAYATITIYTMGVLWPDEHLGVKDKFKMSFSALFIYVLFFIMDTVQIYAISKSFMKFKQIIHRESGPSVWVSPKRSGQTA
jgi:biofilm PGA synthesis N-glycosyltransferase PgaC